MIDKVKTMNEFHGNYMYRPTETGKKGRKVKNHREESCKCFAPFVKLHHHDCPVMMKPCPVHGDLLHAGGRETKGLREQNVIISFHPSSKTERLLQPIRSLLGHFNSETKINFQYYSPGDSISKESLKPQNGQNAYENLKRNFNNNIFVEKTKSFVADKTNKVKKLKQCFHSPCNSIAQRSLSQTSVKEKINQILREEAKQTRNVFYSIVPEVPPDDKKWFSTKKGSSKSHNKLFNENSSSDFITVTQQDKNNAVHHKIFEIKHKKGVNDVLFAGFPRQPTQVVYSAANTGGEPVKQTPDNTEDQKEVKNYNNEKSMREQNEKTEKHVQVHSTEKTQKSVSSSSSSSSSGSGSVYITPFIFVPRGMEDTDVELKSNLKSPIEQSKSNKAIQVEDLATPKEVGSSKQTQTSPQPSKEVIIPKTSSIAPTTENPQMKSGLVHIDSTCDEGTCPSYGRVNVQECEPDSETKVEEIYIGNERTMDRRNFKDDNYDRKQSAITRRTMDSGHPPRTTEVRTDCPYRELLIRARWDNATRDQTSQTEDLWNLEVSVKRFEPRNNKSQVTVPRLAERGMQTSFYQDTSDHSEFIHIHSPNATYVITSFDYQESQQDIDKHEKLWWGKSHSDSELNELLKDNRDENENSFMLSDFSKHSQGGKDTVTRIYDSDGMENGPPGGSITLKTKETIERFSPTKQTSKREDELSAAVSDLSELKKIIQDFFERGNFSRKGCDCNKTVTVKGTKKDGETVTDSYKTLCLPSKSSHKPEKELLGVEVQTSHLLLKVMPKPEKKETSEQEVQTQGKAGTNQEVQTLRKGGNDACVQALVKNIKDVDIQTNIGVLLEEAEQEKPGCKNIRFRRCVFIDHENPTKTSYFCPLCGTEVKNSMGATTSTITVSRPERTERPTLVERECSDVHKVKIVSRTILGKQNEEKNNQNSKTFKPQESPRPKSTLRSGIPVPVPNNVRFRKEETVVPKSSCVFLSNNAKEDTIPPLGQKIHTVTHTYRECVCEPSVSPNSNKDQKTSPPNASTVSKSQVTKDHCTPGPSTSKKPREHRRGPSGSALTENRNKGRRDPFTFPVIIRPFCPRDFMKTWKSMESSTNDNPSSDDSKPQTPKSKRTYEKDLELIGTAAGKKIKVDIEEPIIESTKEYANVWKPEPSLVLKKEHLKIWPTLMMDYQSTAADEQSRASAEQSRASADDLLFEKLTTAPRENSENKEKEFGECEDFYDNNNTFRGQETSSLEKKNRKKKRKRRKKKQQKHFSDHISEHFL